MHVFNTHEKASKRLNLLKGLKFKIDRAALTNLYKALIRPVLEYADVLWDNCTLRECDLIESIQYESARVITGAMKGTSRSRLLDELAWEDMKTRRSIHKLVLYYKIVNNLTPKYLSDLLPQTVQQRSGLSLRNSENITLYKSRTERFKNLSFLQLRHCGAILRFLIAIYPLFKYSNVRCFNTLISKTIINYSTLP